MSKLPSTSQSKQDPDAVRLADLDELIGATLKGAGGPHAIAPDVSAETASTQAASAGSSVAPGKHCHVCGKDVAGQKRYKDRHGYWCPDCHKTDSRKQHRVPRVRCAKCKKAIPESSGFPDLGGIVCSRCQQDLQMERVRDSARLAQLAKKAKSRRMVWAQLAITIGVIGLVYALYHFGVLGSRSSANGTSTRDFMDGARVIGLTFIAMVGVLVWWIKRQV